MGVLSSCLLCSNAGCVDEYTLFVHPSPLGAGVQLFRGRVDLRLVDVRRFENGALALRYVASTADGKVGN